MPSPFSFKNFKAENLLTLLEKHLEEYQSSIDAILSASHAKNPFDSLVLELEKASSRFSVFWQPVNHLNAVKKSDELTKAFEVAQEKVSVFHSRIFQNKKLYQLFLELKKPSQYEVLTGEQKKLVDDYLLSFKHSGIDLSSSKQDKLTELRTRLSKLQEIFQNNVTQSTAEWSLLITEEDQLEGIPEQTLNQARKQAQDQKKEGWLITLNPSIVQQVMSHAQNRALRKAVYEAKLTVASPEGNPKFDNSETILEILKLKSKIAHLLGYKDHVDYSLSDKMAQRQQVEELHFNLAESLRIPALKEVAALKAFAKESLGLDELKPYDSGFISTHYKKAHFNLDEKEIMEYFPVDKVLDGMFEVVNRLFGITLKEEHDFETWDEEVRLFSLYREDAEKCGEIYMDLFARNGEKRSGAWMNECVPRLVTEDAVQNPIAFLSTNFGKGDGTQPSLLTHREVQTAFHEFGHCLHHVLTKAHYPSLGGPSGVPWDAVESPSQMMENWIWDSEAIQLFSEHYKTKQPLPKHHMDSISQLRDYLAASGALRQLSLSSFDMKVYDRAFKGGSEEVLSLWKETCKNTLVTPLPEKDFFPNQFQHIFSGGYSAGYYVYKWALNIAHDMFSQFKIKGLFDEATGRKYLHEVLEPGGMKPFMELVVNFLGRAPNPNALAEALMSSAAESHEPEKAPELITPKAMLLSFSHRQKAVDNRGQMQEEVRHQHSAQPQ